MINIKAILALTAGIIFTFIALTSLSFAQCTHLYDCDNDGFNSTEYNGSDCNDNNPDVYPGAPEYCFGGIDENCNNLTDCHDPICCNNTNCPEGPSEWWFDNDKDSYTTCEDDCNDDNPDVYPGAPEYCFGGIDENCNTLTDCEDPLCIGKTQPDGDICCLEASDCPQEACKTETCENNICTYTQIETNCYNGIDDDCDGAIDCDDNDCANDPECSNEIPEYPPGYIIPILLTLLATYKLKAQHMSL